MRVTEQVIQRILGLWVSGLSSVAGVSQQQPDDARKLLDRVAKQYEEAETVPIEMTEQARSHAPPYYSSQTRTLVC
jgi:hypothetical protein